MTALIVLGALTFGGCGRSPDGIGGDPAAAFPGRAAAVAAAWQAATAQSPIWQTRLVALQPLTVGRLPDEVQLRAAVSLPRETPDPAEIGLPDGSPMTVPLVSAAVAYGDLQRARGTVTVTITAATLGSVELRTNRGLLALPAWLFTVDGGGLVPSPVARVAVDPTTFGIPPQAEIPPWGEPDVAAVDRLVRAEPGRVEFTIGVSACSSEPVGYVHETAEVVVVGGWAQPRSGPCIGALKLVPITVALAGPLAARPILDSVTGRVLL